MELFRPRLVLLNFFCLKKNYSNFTREIFEIKKENGSFNRKICFKVKIESKSYALLKM